MSFEAQQLRALCRAEVLFGFGDWLAERGDESFTVADDDALALVAEWTNESMHPLWCEVRVNEEE